MRIAGVLLAAGRGSRFGDGSKLMADVGGSPLIAWAADAIYWSGFGMPTVVVQSETSPAAALLYKQGFYPLANPRFAEGMGTSIAVAAAYLMEGDKADLGGVLIALADMPFIRRETYAAMIRAFGRADCRAIVMAREGDRRGSPTIFPRALFAELAALKGDEGARSVVARHRELVVEVECAAGELDDVDTPEALEEARRRLAI